PASEVPQLLVWAKSPLLVPVMPMLLMVTVELPVFQNITGWTSMDVSTWCLAIGSDIGESVAEGVLVPVPLRLVVCVLLLALSLTFFVALRLPVAFEVLSLHVALPILPASEVPQLLVWAKSPLLVPVMPMLLMVTVELP